MSTGYSATPLAKKLGIKVGTTLLVVDPPENYSDLISPLPDDVKLVIADSLTDAQVLPRSGKFQLLHIFTNTRDGLFQAVSDSRSMIDQNGAIWISWYKKASKMPTEITEDTVREAALPLGLVDVKVCAVNEKWSGLKLVIRRENRL